MKCDCVFDSLKRSHITRQTNRETGEQKLYLHFSCRRKVCVDFPLLERVGSEGNVTAIHNQRLSAWSRRRAAVLWIIFPWAFYLLRKYFFWVWSRTTRRHDKNRLFYAWNFLSLYSKLFRVFYQTRSLRKNSHFSFFVAKQTFLLIHVRSQKRFIAEIISFFRLDYDAQKQARLVEASWWMLKASAFISVSRLKNSHLPAMWPRKSFFAQHILTLRHETMCEKFHPTNGATNIKQRQQMQKKKRALLNGTLIAQFKRKLLGEDFCI